MLEQVSVGVIIGSEMLSVICSGEVLVMWVVFFIFDFRLCRVVEVYRQMCGMWVRLVMMMMLVKEQMFQGLFLKLNIDSRFLIYIVQKLIGFIEIMQLKLIIMGEMKIGIISVGVMKLWFGRLVCIIRKVSMLFSGMVIRVRLVVSVRLLMKVWWKFGLLKMKWQELKVSVLIGVKNGVDRKF